MKTAKDEINRVQRIVYNQCGKLFVRRTKWQQRTNRCSTVNTMNPFSGENFVISLFLPLCTIHPSFTRFYWFSLCFYASMRWDFSSRLRFRSPFFLSRSQSVLDSGCAMENDFNHSCSSTIVWWIATSNNDAPAEWSRGSAGRMSVDTKKWSRIYVYADPIFLLRFHAKVFIDTNFKIDIGKLKLPMYACAISIFYPTQFNVIVCIFARYTVLSLSLSLPAPGHSTTSIHYS